MEWEGKQFSNIDEVILSVEITSPELGLFNSSGINSFETTEDNVDFFDSSTFLSFELRDYDQDQLEYKIVLEFFNETGNTL